MSGMADDRPRTASSDRAAALAAARRIESELPNLLAWLERPGTVEPAAMWQAVRIARSIADNSAQVVQQAGRAAENRHELPLTLVPPLEDAS